MNNKPQNKYKLTNEQVETFEWLKNQNINTDDETLCYWAKTYSSSRINDVINFAHIRINSGQKIHNIGGWIQKFLKENQIVPTNNSKLNYEFTIEYIKRKKWSDLKIFEKYIRDTITGDDLPLNLPKEDYERSLEALYKKSQLYR